MGSNANELILPLKVIFMILQFFLVGIILYTRVSHDQHLLKHDLKFTLKIGRVHLHIDHS